MARREAVKIVEDAARANLQTKLDALSVTSGEVVPELAEIRDEFSDDTLAPVEVPSVAIMSSPELSPQAQFESFGHFQVDVPMEVVYTDYDGDTAKARQRASYFARAMTQVLNDVIGGATAAKTENGIIMTHMLDLVYDYGLDEGSDRAATVIRFTARMEDTSP